MPLSLGRNQLILKTSGAKIGPPGPEGPAGPPGSVGAIGPQYAIQYNQGGGSLGGSNSFFYNQATNKLDFNGVEFTFSGGSANITGNSTAIASTSTSGNITSTSITGNITSTSTSGNITCTSTSGNISLSNQSTGTLSLYRGANLANAQSSLVFEDDTGFNKITMQQYASAVSYGELVFANSGINLKTVGVNKPINISTSGTPGSIISLDTTGAFGNKIELLTANGAIDLKTGNPDNTITVQGSDLLVTTNAGTGSLINMKGPIGNTNISIDGTTGTLSLGSGGSDGSIVIKNTQTGGSDIVGQFNVDNSKSGKLTLYQGNASFGTAAATISLEGNSALGTFGGANTPGRILVSADSYALIDIRSTSTLSSQIDLNVGVDPGPGQRNIGSFKNNQSGSGPTAVYYNTLTLSRYSNGGQTVPAPSQPFWPVSTNPIELNSNDGSIRSYIVKATTAPSTGAPVVVAELDGTATGTTPVFKISTSSTAFNIDANGLVSDSNTFKLASSGDSGSNPFSAYKISFEPISQTTQANNQTCVNMVLNTPSDVADSRGTIFLGGGVDATWPAVRSSPDTVALSTITGPRQTGPANQYIPWFMIQSPTYAATASTPQYESSFLMCSPVSSQPSSFTIPAITYNAGIPSGIATWDDTALTITSGSGLPCPPTDESQCMQIGDVYKPFVRIGAGHTASVNSYLSTKYAVIRDLYMASSSAGGSIHDVNMVESVTNGTLQLKSNGTGDIWVDSDDKLLLRAGLASGVPSTGAIEVTGRYIKNQQSNTSVFMMSATGTNATIHTGIIGAWYPTVSLLPGLGVGTGSGLEGALVQAGIKLFYIQNDTPGADDEKVSFASVESARADVMLRGKATILANSSGIAINLDEACSDFTEGAVTGLFPGTFINTFVPPDNILAGGDPAKQAYLDEYADVHLSIRKMDAANPARFLTGEFFVSGLTVQLLVTALDINASPLNPVPIDTAISWMICVERQDKTFANFRANDTGTANINNLAANTDLPGGGQKYTLNPRFRNASTPP